MTGARSRPRRILCIDVGSSSLKIAVIEIDDTGERVLLDGDVRRLDEPGATLDMRDYRESQSDESKPLGSATPIAAVLACLANAGIVLDAIGHRLVFGGPDHEEPARVTDALKSSLASLVSFDPLHLPQALAAIDEFERALPAIPQVVCFDTAFHRRMPMVAQRFALPRELWSEGVRRYGFHGLSYESILSTLGAATRGSLVVAHLGSGASLAAIHDGKPVDTTMGLTPLGGLVMGTRSGDLDPGALLYLLRSGRYTAQSLSEMLNHKSGMLGVSQISADVRTLLERRADDVAAAEAVEMFVYSVRKHIGAFAAVLGGLNALVFTGGIGEHSPVIRAEIAVGLEHLGIQLDPVRNSENASIVSVDGARVVVRVIPTNENLMLARHTFATLFAPASEVRRDASRCAPRVVASEDLRFGVPERDDSHAGVPLAFAEDT